MHWRWGRRQHCVMRVIGRAVHGRFTVQVLRSRSRVERSDGARSGVLSMSVSESDEDSEEEPPAMAKRPVLCVRTRLT